MNNMQANGFLNAHASIRIDADLFFISFYISDNNFHIILKKFSDIKSYCEAYGLSNVPKSTCTCVNLFINYLTPLHSM